MNVLSLFDGISCGLIAFKELGFDIEKYISCEIDDYAIKTSLYNFPSEIRIGDVFKADFKKYNGEIDWLIGGSPCTYWSIAQTKERETEASGLGWDLFCQFVRALKESNPKFFIYENNKSMSNKIRDMIRKTFGFDEVCINSSLVSGQTRQRYYWVGVRDKDGTYKKASVQIPVDRKITVKDILTHAGYPVNTNQFGKSQTIKRTYHFTSTCNILCYKSTYGSTGVAEPVGYNDENDFAIPIVSDNGMCDYAKSITDGKKYKIYNVRDKKITFKGKQYDIDLENGDYIIRKFTVAECRDLQTIPNWFKFPVCDTRAYQQIGNGWTIEIIKGLIQNVMETEKKYG